MAVMKTEGGEKHPSSHYLVVEDAQKPSTWHLRVYGADGKPDHTLMGNAWAALHSGFRGNTYDGPNKSQALARLKALYKREGMDLPGAEKAAMSTVHLSAEVLEESAPAAEDLVIRTGLLCRAGAFPDHDWEITPQELRAAADAYAGGGYVELEHLTSQGKPTILDGKLGEVRCLWTSDEGDALYGDVALPAWIDRLSAEAGHKVSAVWERATKAFRGIGLVLDPAVPDAALLSASVAFAKRHDTPQGQNAMQELHDVTARHGAVCRAGNATMASRHESGAIQAMHDMACEHGASCAAVGGRSPVMYSKSEQAEQEEGQTVPDEQNKDAASQEPTVAALQAQLAAEKTQRDADRRALVALQAERRQEKATAFVDALITENKVLPAQRDTLVALHLAAATSDDTRGLVTLADGKEQSLLQSVITALSSFQSLGLTREQLTANPDVAILLNRQKTQEQEDKDKGTPEDNEKLLAMTPLGRQALERKRRAAAGH